MADEILRVDKPQTTDRTSKALWLQRGGAATPSTYEDEWILPDDLLAPEQSAIEANEDNIAVLEVEVAELNDINAKALDKNQNTSYTTTQEADSLIDKFIFRLASGTPTVSVGTVPYVLEGDDDIVTRREITSNIRSIDVESYTETSRTIYITITGGIVDVAIFSKENLFNI